MQCVNNACLLCVIDKQLTWYMCTYILTELLEDRFGDLEYLSPIFWKFFFVLVFTVCILLFSSLACVSSRYPHNMLSFTALINRKPKTWHAIYNTLCTCNCQGSSWGKLIVAMIEEIYQLNAKFYCCLMWTRNVCGYLILKC